MFERAFLRVDVSEGNMSFGFLRRDHFPLSAWLFTKAKGLVWRTVDFVSSTPQLHPQGLEATHETPCSRSWSYGARVGKGMAVRVRATIGDPPWVSVCGAGCPTSPTKWLLLLKDKLNLEKDHKPEANSRVFW